MLSFALSALSPAQRAPILRECRFRIASSGRRHFPLPVVAPLSGFWAIVERYPSRHPPNGLSSIILAPFLVRKPPVGLFFPLNNRDHSMPRERVSGVWDVDGGYSLQEIDRQCTN